ncbi:Heavy metal RND efflux outer membrane protein, CzcC family [hydrothermal vent metagenome]|uniref:Heavy metal RND efflux outer membrane protein, CzcC family n=1 Tax=hydrothermal vent metagenome TaxID=652676 RepID=A0A1W1EDL2_9ZZZZ
MRIILYIFLTFSLLQAESIQQLINYSLNKHPSLKAIQHRLSSMDMRIEKSRNWSNPELILNMNDIRFDDPSNRGLEPMQYQAINYKQRFPWFGKIDARENFTRAQKSIVLDSYSIAKVKLSENIRSTGYTVLEIKERIRIIREYENLTKQNIALYDSYISTDNKSHSNSMSAELLLSRLHIRAERYSSVLKSQEAKLAYLVQRKHINLSDSFRIKRPKSLGYYISNLERNPAYKQALSKTKLASANRDMKALDINPDPFVQVGYFNRQNYEDYASISVGFSLPIFGSEKLETEAARRDLLASKSASLDYHEALESEIRVNYAKMLEAYNIYKIIHNDSLPKLQHMFELNEASIESGEDLFTYTSLLEQKLDLDEERTVAKAAYLRTEAKLKSLIGEI